jgi:hypothetical protein
VARRAAGGMKLLFFCYAQSDQVDGISRAGASHLADGAAMFWQRRKMEKITILATFILAFIPAGASAKDTQFWNLTADTITSLQLSPSGKNEWGRNQADNDRDHTVDHDERLKITDTPAGAYDVKFVDKGGRTCVVPNVQIKTGAIFTIEEKDLKGCSK